MARYIFLVRHAEAIPRGSLAVDDHRWLTSEGRRRFAKVARRFARRGEEIGVILTSPVPRAVMTAEILWQALQGAAPVEVCAELAPDAPLWPALDRLLQAARVAAVGHEPQLGLLLRELCGGAPDKLRKGAVAALRIGRTAPRARLRYLIEP